ncbi:MAG: response regulator [Oscillospiraceae bacterium]|nr:response regulator [Oscillospiraceae bacterium]
MKRVLVCEDELVIREFVVINLKRAGYDVVDTDCGEAALRAYSEANGNFDIAVLDIMMPGIDGLEVCRQLRAQSAELGIILLTAKAQQEDRQNGMDSGADMYVTKPFSPSVLTTQVNKLYALIHKKTES